MNVNKERKVTIIVPVYNTKEYLERIFNSLKAQTYHNLEIIFVDDGSTDGSGDVCDNFKRSDKRIKVYHQRNKGSSAARNVGLEKMTGEYVTFIDSDDDVDPDYVSSFMNKIEGEEKPVIVQEGLDMSKYCSKSYDDINCERTLSEWYDYMMTEKISTGAVAKMLPTKIARKARFNNEFTIGEDIYYYYCIINTQTDAKVIIDTSLKKYHYCRRADSLTVNNDNIESWNNNIAVFRTMRDTAACDTVKESAEKGLYLLIISVLIRNLKSKAYNRQYGLRLHGELKKLGIVLPNNQGFRKMVRVIVVRFFYSPLRLIFYIKRKMLNN